jgi:predicted MFS family arabinose efflux permease
MTVAYAARFAAGGFSGLLWGMLAGYARRIARPSLAGRALAVASIGTPAGLAVGTPLGSWLGTTAGWRWAFAGLAALTVITLALVLLLVPDAPGQPAETRMSLLRVAVVPGVAAILAIITTWMIAHNTLYTYLASYLRAAGTDVPIDLALVTFGVAAVAGLAVTGAVIDRALRPLALASMALFAVTGVILATSPPRTTLLFAITLWGLAYGGAATQLQTAIANASGPNADVANSMLGVAFNIAIFAAGVLGAVLISAYDGLALTAVMIALAAIALTISAATRSTSFHAAR